MVLIAGLKLIVGMAIYGLILSVARSYAAAAGMLLTFPALNGFALALSPSEKLAKTSRIMIIFPIVNGLLCAAYMLAFQRVTDMSGAVGLIATASVIWLVFAYFWGRTEGVPDRYLAAFAISSALVALAITCSMLSVSHSAASSNETTTWVEYIYEGRWRIALFAVCLAGVIIVTDYLIPTGRIKDRHAAGLLGTLGAFPVVPFFGLWTIAANEAIAVDVRVKIFAQMGSTVWLGPVLAIWYIYALSSYLRASASEAMKLNWLRKLGLAFVGWVFCFGLIASVSTFVR